MGDATCASTRTTMIHVVSAQDLVGSGDYTHLREGFLLKLMDLCTCASAETLSGHSSVTLAVDDLMFSGTRLRAGETVQVSSQVNCAWGTSMECGCTVVVDNNGNHSECRGGGGTRHVCRAFFTFVSLGRDGKKIRLPKLIAADDVDNLRRMTLANEWRKIRFRRKSIIAHAAETLSLRVRSSRLGTGTTSAKCEAKKKNGEEVDAAETTPATPASIELGYSQQIPAPLLVTTEIVLPQHANHHGNTFGGQIMAWMSTAARVVASRHVEVSQSTDSGSGACSRPNPAPIVVAQSIDDIFFVAPSRVGDRVTIQSRVTRTFARTLEVQCVVYAHAIGEEKRLINRAVWVFAATAQGMGGQGDGDENGKGVRDLMPLLQVDPNHSAEARAAFEQALGRRALRIKRNALGSGHNLDPSWEWNIADEVGGGGAGAEGGGAKAEEKAKGSNQHVATPHVEYTARNVSSLLKAFWHKGSTTQSAWGLLEAASTQATKLFMREDKDLIHVRAVSRLAFLPKPSGAPTATITAVGAATTESEPKSSSVSMFGFGSMFKKRRPSAGAPVASTKKEPIARVFAILCDNASRHAWDILCESSETVCTLDEHNDITRLVFKNPSAAEGEVALSDFALLRSWRVNNDRSRFLIANHSIRAPKIVPEVEGCVRGAVASSGWVLETVKESEDSAHDGEAVVELTYLVTLAAAGIQALGATAVDVLAGRSKVICHNIAGIAKAVGATLREDGPKKL